jgi:hypothetical protein
MMASSSTAISILALIGIPASNQPKGVISLNNFASSLNGAPIIDFIDPDILTPQTNSLYIEPDTGVETQKKR